MKNRILTIVCMIGAGLAACVVLDKPAGVQAAISNPSYFKSLIIGGGITDADGGAQIEDNGNITTTGDITLDDLNIGDDVDINGDLNVDGVTTLDDTTIDGPLDVNGASTFDVDVEFYDATQDPDELVGFVNTDYDTDTGQIGATGNLLAINDPFSPTSIAGVGIIGPIADRTTNQAPRLELMSATDYMDMALESGGVGVDMPSGTDTTLTVGNSGAGDGVVQADRLAVEFPGINSTTDSIYIDDTGLNFDIGQGGFAPPYNVPFLYTFSRGDDGALQINETDSATSATGRIKIGDSSEELRVSIYGPFTASWDDYDFGTASNNVGMFFSRSGEGVLSLDIENDVVTLESVGDITLDATDSTANSTVTVTNSNSTYNANLSVEGFMILGPTFPTANISSGAFTATSSVVILDTESSASTDDLDTINGGVNGARLTLMSANSARDIVVKNNTGNIRCDSDFTLNTTSDTIELIFRSGSGWKKISSSTN